YHDDRDTSAGGATAAVPVGAGAPGRAPPRGLAIWAARRWTATAIGARLRPAADPADRLRRHWFPGAGAQLMTRSTTRSATRDELTDAAADAAIEQACRILRLPTIRAHHARIAESAARQK